MVKKSRCYDSMMGHMKTAIGFLTAFAFGFTLLYIIEKDVGNPAPWHDCPQSTADCPKMEPAKERCRKLDQVSEGIWKDDYYHPKTCYIKRFSTEEANRCLTNRTIAMIGDSTMGGFWRHAKFVLGENREYAEVKNLTVYLLNRKPGDIRLPRTVTIYSDTNHYLIRSYGLWRDEMWDTLGYGAAPDNANHTIRSILLNQTNDLVLVNIAAHHQDVKVGGVVRLSALHFNIMELYQTTQAENATKPVPLLWVSMNAQYAEKKTEERRHQNVRLSKTINLLADYIFTSDPNVRVPTLDIHSMMASNLPELSADGMHADGKAEIVKWHMLLNFLCLNEDGTGFDATFKNSW